MKSLFQDTTLSYADSHYEKTTNRVETETALNIRRSKSSDTDKSLQPILCNFTSTGKCKSDFNQSNICFVDIDTTEYTDYIISNSEKLFESLPFILAIQKSFSGKIHLICRMPLVNNLIDFCKQSISIQESVYLYLSSIFNKSITYGFGSNKEGIHYEIDLNSIKANQLLYVSTNDFILNYKYDESKVDISFFNKVNFYNEFKSYIYKYCNINDDIKVVKTLQSSIENPDNNIYNNHNTIDTLCKVLTTCEEIENEEDKDVKVFDLFNPYNEVRIPYCKNMTILDFKPRFDLDELKAALVKSYSNKTYGRLIFRPYIKSEGMYSIKLINYHPKEKLKQGQHRRLNIKRELHRIVLNAIATDNYLADSGREYTYMVNDILATLKYYIENYIELNCNRIINDDTIKTLISDLFNNFWNEEYASLYSIGYYYHPACSKDFEDEFKQWMAYNKRMKSKVCEESAIEFITDNDLLDKSNSELANILNENIISKTKKGWSDRSVYELKRSNKTILKDPSRDYFDRLKELYYEGKKYAEIASILNSEGYKTSNGKEFNRNNIKQLAYKIKNNDKTMEETIEIKKPNKELIETNQELDITQKLMIETQLYFNNPSAIDLIPSVSSYTEFASKVSYNIKK